MVLRRFGSVVLALAVAASLDLPAARAASPQPGGYGPLRLGMAQADAKRALSGIARDVVFLPTSPNDPSRDITNHRIDGVAVMMPSEHLYFGRLDTDTRVQVGAHDGRVVTVMLRTRIAAQGAACRDAFNALVARNEAEFGPVPAADMPGDPHTFSNGQAGFDGWTLYLGRIQQSGGQCALTADYIASTDKEIKTSWRAHLRGRALAVPLS